MYSQITMNTSDSVDEVDVSFEIDFDNGTLEYSTSDTVDVTFEMDLENGILEYSTSEESGSSDSGFDTATLESYIRKVNSDFSEPLNYTNYIYDISVFGANSYVMDLNNYMIWDELALKSCYIYGHTGIHQYVYDRLTEENVDNLFNLSPYLGRQLNNFHNNKAYAVGDVNAVLAGMTLDAYNNCIDKMRHGYQRYVNRYLNMESGVGTWINEVYGVDLSSYETAAEIVADAEAWNLVLVSEPLMVALTSSEEVMTLIYESEAATERFADAIYYAGQNEVAMNVICNYDELVQKVVNDQTSMEWIANSENAMLNVLEHENFATQALASEVAMIAMGNNIVAVNVICDFVGNLNKSQNALISINASIEEINAWINDILNGSTLSGKLTDAHDAVETAVDATNAVTENANIVDEMALAICQNETFVYNVFANTNIHTVLYNREDCPIAAIMSAGAASFLTIMNVYSVTTMFEFMQWLKDYPYYIYWYMKARVYRFAEVQAWLGNLDMTNVVATTHNSNMSYNIETVSTNMSMYINTNTALSFQASYYIYTTAIVGDYNIGDTVGNGVITSSTSYTLAMYKEQLFARPSIWRYTNEYFRKNNANNSNYILAFNPIADTIELVDIIDEGNGTVYVMEDPKASTYVFFLGAYHVTNRINSSATSYYNAPLYNTVALT